MSVMQWCGCPRLLESRELGCPASCRSLFFCSGKFPSCRTAECHQKVWFSESSWSLLQRIQVRWRHNWCRGHHATHHRPRNWCRGCSPGACYVWMRTHILWSNIMSIECMCRLSIGRLVSRLMVGVWRFKMAYPHMNWCLWFCFMLLLHISAVMPCEHYMTHKHKYLSNVRSWNFRCGSLTLL